jgi:hypothetical protein
MSTDEFVLLTVSFVMTCFGAYGWHGRIVSSTAAAHSGRLFFWLGVAPLPILAAVFLTILTAGSYDVRGAPQYLLLYTVVGSAWIFAAAFSMHWLGISFQDDALERRNKAAAIILVFIAAAHAAIYAGANIGDGPGWWCVMAAALIGTGAWFVLWSIAEFCCGIAETITVERDVSAAVRLGGYALAMGLICGRGSAGDWTSLDQTFVEFRAAWPILPLTLVVIAVERLMRARSRQDRFGIAESAGIAVIYIAAAVIAVGLSEPLPDNPLYDRVEQSR